MPTKIEWTEESWNPITGCTKCAPGCLHCYAERMAKRLRGRFGYPADEPFRVTWHPEKLNEPLDWRKPRQVFVCSMGDLFHEDVPFVVIDRVFAVMAVAQWHTFQVLTKRGARRLDYAYTRQSFGLTVDQAPQWYRWVTEWLDEGQQGFCGKAWDRCHAAIEGLDGIEEYLPNVWQGSSVSTQPDADREIPLLLKTPAAVRFVSAEPLLEEIDAGFGANMTEEEDRAYGWIPCHEGGIRHQHPLGEFVGGPCARKLDLIIIGCESGPGRRPCKLDWVHSLIEQADAAEVPVFVKQLEIDGKVSHNPAEWPKWARRREQPKENR